MPDYRFVSDDKTLASVLRDISLASTIAVDTEFMRVNTYYPKIALIQVNDGNTCCLIDPLAIDDLSPLSDLLGNPDILKVLHSCSEDLEIFQHHLGLLPRNLIDTQIAAAALGLGFTISYRALVEHYLGLTLAKDETRSDWLQRPLSDSQCNYAARDVIHLLDAWHKQQQELADTPKAHWVEVESSKMGTNMHSIAPVERAYLRVKGYQKLEPRQLQVLQALCSWRESRAREKNLPRHWIADDRALLTIVREQLTSRSELAQMAGMTARQIRTHADGLLATRSRAWQAPVKSVQESTKAKPIDKNLLKELKARVRELAETLQVAPELLARQRHLEQLLASVDEKGSYQLPEELTGWRQSVIGEPLLAVLKKP